MRDMTKAQFAAALERHGMKPVGFMGYVELGIEGMRTSVSVHNAGTNRRNQLAYLFECKARYEAESLSARVKKQIDELPMTVELGLQKVRS